MSVPDSSLQNIGNNENKNNTNNDDEQLVETQSAARTRPFNLRSDSAASFRRSGRLEISLQRAQGTIRLALHDDVRRVTHGG